MIHGLGATPDEYEFDFPYGPPTLSALDARRRPFAPRGRAPRGRVIMPYHLVVRPRRGGVAPIMTASGMPPSLMAMGPGRGFTHLEALGKRKGRRHGGGFAPWEWHKAISPHHLLFRSKKRRKKKRAVAVAPEEAIQVFEAPTATQALLPTPTAQLPAPAPPTSMIPGEMFAPAPTSPAAQAWAPPEAAMAVEAPSAEDYLPEDEGARGALIPSSEEYAYPDITARVGPEAREQPREFEAAEIPTVFEFEEGAAPEDEEAAAAEAEGEGMSAGPVWWYQPTPPGLAPGFHGLGAEKEQWFKTAARAFTAVAPGIVEIIGGGGMRTPAIVAAPSMAVAPRPPAAPGGGAPAWLWPAVIGVGALGVVWVLWPSSSPRRRRRIR